MKAAEPGESKHRSRESPRACRPGDGSGRDPGVDGRELIFVVGMPRSGTTLMTAMLNAHSSVHAGPETHFFSFLTARLRLLFAPRAAASDVIRAAVRDEAIRQALATADERAGTRLWPFVPSTARRLFLDVLGVAPAERWPVLVEKTPDHLEYLPLIRALFPGARILVMQRDPRAVYSSLKKVPWFHSSLPRFCARWCFYQRHAGRASRNSANGHVIPYEELVTAPERVLTEVQQWLGLAIEPVWTRYLEADSRVYVADQETWKDNAARPVNADRARAWQKELSPAEIRRIESLAGDCMHAAGYADAAAAGSRRRAADIPYLLMTRARLLTERAGIVAISWWYALMNALAGRTDR